MVSYGQGAAVDLMANDQVSQTRQLKGDKFHIMEALEQLEGVLKLSNAYRRSDKDSWFLATNTPEILGFQGY